MTGQRMMEVARVVQLRAEQSATQITLAHRTEMLACHRRRRRPQRCSAAQENSSIVLARSQGRGKVRVLGEPGRKGDARFIKGLEPEAESGSEREREMERVQRS